MSFDFNPYKHVELIHTGPDDVSIYCHGCGAEWGHLSTEVAVAEVFNAAAAHVRGSHRREPADFAGWSSR